MSAVTPAQAAAPATSHLSATASPLTALPHNTVTIAGAVTPRGAGVVTLQRYAAGKWTPLGHKTSSKSGAYTFSLHTSGTLGVTIYRVTRAASGTAKAAVSKTMHVRVTKTVWKVKASAHPTVAAGKPIVVTGSVANKAQGFVVLEVLTHGTWKDIATGRLTKASTFSFSHVLPSGSYALRVRKPLTSTVASGVSPAVHVVVAAPAKAAPTATTSLAGSVVSPGVYSGTVTVTAGVTAAAGIKSTTYILDGAAAKPYTAAVPVTTTGAHSFKVTVTDLLGRTATATATWTIAANTADKTPPTATVSLGGTVYPGGAYGAPVTVTINAADPGSGLKSVTYTLDGANAVAYTAPFEVTTVRAHTLGVTATDNAGNVFTSGATTWTEVAADTTVPTATITLAGTKSGSVYTSNVTATVAAADTGGSGLKSVSYSLDGGTQTPYTAPVVIPAQPGGNHTLVVTALDGAGNAASASTTWTQTSGAPDGTPPVVTVGLAGTGSGTAFTGPVQVNIAATDSGSGVASVTYKLDSASPVTSSSSPVSFGVGAVGSHTVTVTATDIAGNTSAPRVVTWTQSAATTLPLAISSTDQATLHLTAPRLVFSSYRGGPAAAARQYTLTNTTGAAIQVSGLAIIGADASSFKLDTGQATSFSVPAGGSAQVSILFTPTDPTGCADTASPDAIGDVNRAASLTFTTDAAGETTASADLAGVNACYFGGNNEPVLDQVLTGLGYDETHIGNGFDRRFIGPSRALGSSDSDEVISPYFTSADGGPVSLVPLAHYGTGSDTAAYQTTGWYAKGSTMTAPRSTCSSACQTLFNFPADFSATSFNQNQKLLPTPTGVTSFTPTVPFGLFSGDFTDVNFSDDSLNVGHGKDNNDLPVAHYLHNMRIFQAYQGTGADRVAIPNTYLVGIDLSRVPAFKNNDYQDVVLLLTNAQPATGQGRVLTASGDNLDLTTATVGANCSVSGFDGVMPSTAPPAGFNPCAAGNITTSAQGLVLTSTAGQLADHNQTNALYQTFDASRGAFTISTRVIGSTDQLQSNYQQLGAFFGMNDSNFIKIEAEHNGTPGLTLFYDEGGHTASAASATPAGLTTASTLDLVIKGNTSVRDTVSPDTQGVDGYPLDELTVWYSINGGPLTQIGTTIEFPADVTGWFSRQAKAGILVASPSSATPITATFSQFSISAG